MKILQWWVKPRAGTDRPSDKLGSLRSPLAYEIVGGGLVMDFLGAEGESIPLAARFSRWPLDITSESSNKPQRNRNYD